MNKSTSLHGAIGKEDWKKWQKAEDEMNVIEKMTWTLRRLELI